MSSVTDLQYTHRPTPLGRHEGALEVLVYLRQSCSVFPLPAGGVVRVGRGQNNEVRIDDPSVSRFHLALHVGDAIEVEDLGSANGTQLFRSEPEEVGDQPTQRNEAEARLGPAERRTLGAGDFIRAGIALLVVQAQRAAPRPTAGTVVAGSAISSRPPKDFGPAVLLDPEMKRAYEIALRAAQSGISVLISGETGAGKEIFAETIHARSNRRNRPLLRLNCAALSETLLESELFGHERGAFTGATQTKVGLLESNDQGTVFLDEIGEMPLSTQAKLLRVLEEKSILRVGATKPRPIDVRFIWATNRDLRSECRLGRFRHDLYFRITGVEFSIPPLRKRQIEIEPLARLFLEQFCRRSGIPIPQISAEGLAALQQYSWPGNVRELKNVMERAPFVCGGGPITAELVPVDGDGNGLFPPEELESTQVLSARTPRSSGETHQSTAPVRPLASGPKTSDPESERLRIAEALERCAGNQTRAAGLLGVSRRTLINRLERLNMPRPKKGS